ncbi:hypothetical protein [Hydrogenophaga sp. BPS33]|uniref:hypothetical protein n=1 Tax=Hydrogenophaga sp. BPS33 TaxID=2651974 RepID=UPI00131F727D|nr:hypothetical protein [Hydrogenophaga sp. BPS33]QHE86312.1 hypothetical protein F9K07_16075 [Hydrogenophaga sp. BPS33]
MTTNTFMSTGSMLSMVGQIGGGLASAEMGKTQNALAKVDAAYERDTAEQQATRVRREVIRQKGAARAATAASGARLDEFALGPEHEIGLLGAQDAEMLILSGNRRSDALLRAGRMAEKAGNNKLMASLFSSAGQAYGNWKGAKKAVDPVSAFYFDGKTGMGD